METAVQASSEENGIQKLCRDLHTKNTSFPQLVDILFVDWVVVFAAGCNSFDTKFLEQVVKCPMKTAKGKLARTKLRYVSPRPGEVAKRNDAVRREAGKAYKEDTSLRSPIEFLL